MGRRRISAEVWTELGACLAVVILSWANRRNRGRKARTTPEHKDPCFQDSGHRSSHDPLTQGPSFGGGLREQMVAAAAAAAGFELYKDGEREPLVPPVPLSDHVRELLASFDVDPIRGFLPSVDPLRELPQPEYRPWEAMAADLPKLLTAGQARRPLEKLPVISIDMLTCHRERMRALLLLCTLAHASVWGNPDKPQDTIPKGVAFPLHALAAVEGMPPLMTHASLVLHNWHKLDPSGPLRVENLACNSRFLGGQDETWFYMITVEIEARGGGVFGALLQAQHAINNLGQMQHRAKADQFNVARTVMAALRAAQAGINEMRQALSRMPEGCHPLIFYQRVRPFLSGWKANPSLPNGVLYEGVSSERREFYGGSAAQSTLFPALDAAFQVSHEQHSSNTFLLEMRKYMPPGHRRLLEHLSDPTCPSIRTFVENVHSTKNDPDNCSTSNGSEKGSSNHASVNGKTKIQASDGSKNVSENGRRTGSSGGAVQPDRTSVDEQESGSCTTVDVEHVSRGSGTVEEGNGSGSGGLELREEAEALREAYNDCLKALHDFRSTHLGIVSSYILQHQKRDWKAEEANSRGDFAGGKGTGGTQLFDFLKPLKEDARSVLLKK